MPSSFQLQGSRAFSRGHCYSYPGLTHGETEAHSSKVTMVSAKPGEGPCSLGFPPGAHCGLSCTWNKNSCCALYLALSVSSGKQVEGEFVSPAATFPYRPTCQFLPTILHMVT